LLQKYVAQLVALRLITTIVGLTVNFHHERALTDEEVGDIRPDRVLSPNLET